MERSEAIADKRGTVKPVRRRTQAAGAGLTVVGCHRERTGSKPRKLGALGTYILHPPGPLGRAEGMNRQFGDARGLNGHGADGQDRVKGASDNRGMGTTKAITIAITRTTMIIRVACCQNGQDSQSVGA